jgi:hypothetical protein
MSVSYLDIPENELLTTGHRKIYFRRKTDNKEKYIYLHPEDKDYILFWCDRLVVDVLAKQIIDPTFCEELFKQSKGMPVSGYSKLRNSPLTFAAGIVSNMRRNPAEDIAYKQIEYIIKLFKIINYAYSVGELHKELGYNSSTKKDNAIPNNIIFKEA